MRKEKSAGVIVFYIDKATNNEIKFLLLKYPSYWGFIKGIIEKDEETESTIKREAKEEANLDNLEFIKGFQYTQKWFFRSYDESKELISKEADYLLAEISKKDSENIKISSEHEDFKWVSFEEALNSMKIKSNKEMLEKANEFIKEWKKQGKLEI